MGSPAARRTDKVAGSDTHIVLVPCPAAGAPVPTSAARPRLLRPDRLRHLRRRHDRGPARRDRRTRWPATRRRTCRSRRAPPSLEPPSNRGTVSARLRRASTINGKAAARLGDPVRTCNDPRDRDAAQDHHRREDGDDRMTDFPGRGVAFPLLPDAGGTLRLRRRRRRGGPVAAAAADDRGRRAGDATQPSAPRRPRLVFAPGSETNLRLLESSGQRGGPRPRAAGAARRRRGDRGPAGPGAGRRSKSPTRSAGPTPATASSSRSTSPVPGVCHEPAGRPGWTRRHAAVGTLSADECASTT